MSDLLATALGLAFALVVCLLTVQALLGPWLRLRRSAGETKVRSQSAAPRHGQTVETTPVHSA